MIERCFRNGAIAGAFLLIVTATTVTAAPKTPAYAPGQVIIKFKSSVAKSDVLSAQGSIHARTRHRFASIGAELWEFDGLPVTDAIERLRHDPRVAYVEPNYRVQADDVFPNDPRFADLWGLHNIGQTGGTADADVDAPEAWLIGTGGSVLVGIIDTGVDWHHPDLAANIYTNPGEIPGNGADDDGNGYVDDIHGWDFVNNDNDPYDDHYHGTHVAGTIAAIGNNGIGVAGVSWSAKILPIKFLDEEGYGWTDDAVLAVEYATRMGVRLTNNSWGGGGYSQALHDAIQAAGDHGILFIAAAGNDSENTDAWAHYPSSYDLDNIISVASTDSRDELSWFSNFGPVTVDLAAPGSDILSTFPNSSYGTISGTSMATPHVSGAVCLAWAIKPSMTHLELKSAILASADPLPSLSGQVLSGARLNAYQLVSALDDTPPARVTNLGVASTGSTTARLRWTATGDDGTTGAAAVYDLRYSTSAIDAANFDAATRVPGLPKPATAGSDETFEVTGLDYRTRYHFALVVEDERGNRSALSKKNPSGVTMAAPLGDFAPLSFSGSLRTGGTQSQTLVIRNTAQGTLDYTVSEAPAWVRMNPASGRIHAQKSLQVDVIFDATRLAGGPHDGAITLATNDATRPSVVLPVSLAVTDAPDITVSPATLDFGFHYTGMCATDTVVIANIGTAPLHVDRPALGAAAFSSDATAFALAPGETRAVLVNFCPVSTGAFEATLSLESDDPDHPTTSVTVRGQAADAPAIAVAPLSLDADLHTGQSEPRTLSISNHGGSDLQFQLTIANAASSQTENLAAGDDARRELSRDITPESRAPAAAAAGSSYSSNGTRAHATPAKPSPPSILSTGNMKVLLLFTGEVSGLRGWLQSFPDIAVVDQFNGEAAVPTPAALASYDAVILANDYPYGNPIAIGDVLADFVDDGGAVVMTIASFVSGWDVRGRFASGGYLPFTVGRPSWDWAEMGDFDAAHPIMAGVTEAYGDLVAETTTAAGAEWVASWDNGSALVATRRERVVGVNVFLPYDYYWGGDVPLILHNALAWAVGASWLSVEPAAGTIAAQGHADVAVRFDGHGLFGGDYAANLRVVSNDPARPRVSVPAALHVTGAADIMVSESTLDYGGQFVGTAVKDTLVVSNDGTDLLTVSGISSSHPAYAVDTSSLSLAPGESRRVIITFSPATVGSADASLTLLSDDLDEGSLAVALRGSGIEPPVISITPPSLSAELPAGTNVTQSLTIANTGKNPLEFLLAIEGSDSPLPVEAVVLEESAGAVTASALPPASPGRIRKGEVVTRSYPPMTREGGGPDGGGYHWRDNRDPYGPQFDWIDVGTGTSIPLWDDDFARDIPLGFAFRYYGEEFTTIGVASNGWLSFNGADDWYPYEVPSEDYARGAIAPFASDLYPPGGYIRYQTFGAAPRRQFVVEYNHIEDYVGGQHKTFEVIFYESSNSIRFQYLVAPNRPIGFGVESPDESMGIGNAGTGELFISPDLVRDGYAIEFSRSPSWARAALAGGVVPPHRRLSVEVTFDAARILGGDYAAVLRVAHNDPAKPVMEVPLALHVTGVPDIVLADSLMDYGARFVGAAVKDTLVVSNPGTGTLTVSDIASSHPDFGTDVGAFSLLPRTSRDVIVTFTPRSLGPIAATLSLTSDDPDAGVATLLLRGAGLAPPVASVTPAYFMDDLVTGETAAQSLTIANSGESALSFYIGVEALPAASGGAADSTRPAPAAAAAGGADAYGYRWRDCNQLGGPLFEWIDASGGTNITLYYDFLISGIPLGFDFEYYGRRFSTIKVAANGWLSFNAQNGSFVNDVPLLDEVAGVIAPFSFDLSPSEGGYVRYLTFGAAPRRTFVVEYNNILDWSTGSRSTFEVMLSEQTHSIRFQYLHAPHPPDGIGIESPDQTTGMGDAGTGDLFISPARVRDHYAIEFSIAPKWLRVEPRAGTVAPHTSVDVPVVFDAGGLFGGDYDANLHVATDDPVHPDVVVAARLHVTGAPDISVEPASLAFAPLFIGLTAEQSVSVSNEGTDMLAVGTITSSHPDYSASRSSFTLAPGATEHFFVTFAPTVAGPVPAVLTLYTNDPDEGQVVVSLQGAGLVPPVISISPATLTADVLAGNESSQPVTIDNTAGGSPLVWTASVQASGWFRLDPLTGTVPAGTDTIVTAIFDSSGRIGGDYDGTLIFHSNDPITPQIQVPLQMHVTGAPNIALSPGGPLDYGPVYVGQTASRTVVVSNVGTDLLSVTSISSNHASFAADANTFDLVPHATRDIVISFSPATPGAFSGAVTIASNDPEEGLVSIAVAGTGVEPPVISVTPDALADTLIAGGTATKMLTVSNGGASDLNITVILQESDASSSIATVESSAGEAAVADIAKGSEDTRSYPPMTRSAGGPDAFGYRWRDSNEPGGPTFHWIDVSGGADLFLEDDGFVEDVPLGFTFEYYGQSFAAVGVGSNGWLSFTGAQAWFPASVPLPDLYPGAIAPYARDLIAPGAYYVRYQTLGTAPRRRFVIEYNNIPDWGGLSRKTFEVIFTEGSNAIRFQYLVAPNPPIGFGIESPDQRAGMGNAGAGDLFISPALVTDHYAIEFSTAPAWLSVEPENATIPPGASLPLVVTLRAEELAAGQYAGVLLIRSNDPVTPDVSVPVLLTVEPDGVMAAAPAAAPAVTIEIPKHFSLQPNRPNPFNPSTTIAYDLPRAVDVGLVVYDVRGAKIREWAVARQPAGRHEVVWDGRDAANQPVASGVYFYRLTAGAFVQTRKMILLK